MPFRGTYWPTQLFPDGSALFYRPDGRLIPEVPPQPKEPENPPEALRARNVEKGILITGEGGGPKWGYEPIDWDYAVDVPLQNLALRRKNEGPSLHQRLRRPRFPPLRA